MMNFYVLNDNSIMESVVLRSGVLLQEQMCCRREMKGSMCISAETVQMCSIPMGLCNAKYVSSLGCCL